LRIVILSKALVVGAYHGKLTQLAALPDVELTAIVPPSWRDERGTLRLERTTADNYQLVVTPIRFNGSFHLHYYPQLDRLLRQLQPDILHVDEEPYNLATFLALRSARRIHARSLFFSWQNLNRRYPFPFNLIERAVLDQASACIAGNHEAEHVWRAKGYRGLIEIIPQFGVDPDVFAPAADHQAARQLVIGYVGRFVDEKGIDLLLKALSKLNDDWRADLIGSGPARARLIELTRRLNLADRVRWLNWIPSSEIRDFYRTLDVLVLPSRTKPNWKEQFGRVLVEAMACGVPVIGSTCGEIPNVVGDAGLSFLEGDVDALHGQLSRLQRDAALRTELSQRGRQRVLDHFTQAQIAHRTYEVYRRIMNNE
jgi:glycosyltransferase involved in cell wall biosynthesis